MYIRLKTNGYNNSTTTRIDNMNMNRNRCMSTATTSRNHVGNNTIVWLTDIVALFALARIIVI